MSGGRMRRALVAVVGLCLALGALVMNPTVEETDAAFTDSEYASTALSAAELVAPTAGTCTVTTKVVVLVGIVFDSVTMTWTSPYPKENVRLTVTRGSQTVVVDPGDIIQSGPTNGTYTYTVTLNQGLLESLIGNLLGSTTTLTVVNVAGEAWHSPAHTRQLYIGLLGLSPSCT